MTDVTVSAVAEETVATEPQSSTMPVASPSIRLLDVPAATMRAYAIVRPPDLYFERVTTLVAMLEHPVALAAPVGSMLIVDSDDGAHGVVCAERALGGWVLR